MTQFEMVSAIVNVFLSIALLVSWIALWLKNAEADHIRYEYEKLLKKHRLMSIMMKDRD